MSLKEDLAKVSFGFSLMLKQYKDRILGEEFQGLTVGQYMYLRAIGTMDDPTPGALADRLKLSRPTITITLGKLEHLGYLTKEHSAKDGRFTRILLTEKGRKISEADHFAYDAFIALLHKRLSKEEYKAFESIAGKLADAALDAAGYSSNR